jgi:hypothetical protein
MRKWGTASLLGLALAIYLALTWNTNRSVLHYSPADVVYSDKIHAVHDMILSNITPGPGRNTSVPGVSPAIRVSEQFYDFGEVNAQQVLARAFVIANYGESPLVILRAYTTCGCTIADFTAEVIPPGKVALMTLQFDTGYHDMRGTTVRRGVIIETNDPEHPTQEIWIQATGR